MKHRKKHFTTKNTHIRSGMSKRKNKSKNMFTTTKLFNYLKIRSKIENVPFEIDEKYFEKLFKSGIRMFFGVMVDDSGLLIFDFQEPYEGFFYEIIHEIQNTIYEVKY